jgi:hypothetical protein
LLRARAIKIKAVFFMVVWERRCELGVDFKQVEAEGWRFGGLGFVVNVFLVVR